MSSFFEQIEERGYKIGYECGYKIGYERGYEIGKTKKLKEVVGRMIKYNYTNEEIKLATKASDELIEEIRKTLLI